MERGWYLRLSVVFILVIASCTTTQQEITMPTLAILPSATITNTPLPSDTPTATSTPTETPLPTLTFTPTSTATETPTTTATATVTLTPSPTNTQTPSVTPTPLSDAYVSNPAGVNLRRGPSTNFNPPILTLDQDDLINILAMSTDTQWYKVQTLSGQIGWVFGDLIDFYRDLPPDLPVEFIPTPTITPEVPDTIIDNSGGGSTGSSAVVNAAQTTGFELGGQAISFSYPQQMRDAGMKWVKRQIRWNGSDPASNFQFIIDSSKGNGFKVLLSVVGDQNQLAANPTQYYQNYANFVGGLAAGGADAIEVWNEMNIAREWPSGFISGANYTQMLQTAYPVIKSRNAGTLVISGAPAPTGGFGGCTTAGGDDDCFIRDMAAAGAANYMDCVGIHYNSGSTPPSATSGANVGSPEHYSWYYQSIVNLYISVFPGKPLCFTELGYLTGEGIGALPASYAWAANNTLADQSNWLAEAVRLARQGGIRLMIVWNVDATSFGVDPQMGYAIVRPGGVCPACSALRNALN